MDNSFALQLNSTWTQQDNFGQRQQVPTKFLHLCVGLHSNANERMSKVQITWMPNISDTWQLVLHKNKSGSVILYYSSRFFVFVLVCSLICLVSLSKVKTNENSYRGRRSYDLLLRVGAYEFQQYHLYGPVSDRKIFNSQKIKINFSHLKGLWCGVSFLP